MRKRNGPKQGLVLLPSHLSFIQLTNISVICIYGRGRGGNIETKWAFGFRILSCIIKFG